MNEDPKILPVARGYDPAAALMEPSSFDHLYRVGKMLAASALFPEHLRKGSPEQAAANGALVMNMAVRMREDPLTVAQAVYFVGGKPGWSTQYVIAKANQHGTFSDQIDWRIEGQGESLSVTAFATLAKSGRKVSMTCDMEMAKAEGWAKNPKYKTMPEVMLRYRSAAFLIRMYCPEVMVGIPASIEVELETMRDVTPHADVAPVPAREEPPVEDAVEIEEEKPEPKKAAAKKAEKPKEEAKAEEAPPSDEDNPFTSVAERIMGDMLDGPVDGVLAMWEQELNQMEGAAPDLYKRVMDYAEEIQKGHG
jgi:hypothetical protein